MATTVPEGAIRLPDPEEPIPADAEGTTAAVKPGPSHRRRHRGRQLDEGRRERLISAATWVRNIGALLILFAVWQLWGTAIAQHHSQASLQQQFEAKIHAAPHRSGPVVLAPASAHLTPPPDGSVIGLLQIPKIGLSQYVVSGTDDGDLAKGPGHYTGTAEPGQAGNVAIAGHRTTHGAPFNHLNNLAPGDLIFLTDLNGQRLTYAVAQAPYVVPPSNIAVLNDFGDNRLTLTTCNPEFSATQRLIVVAAYQSHGAPQPLHSVATNGAGTPYQVSVAGQAGWNISLIPLVLVELGVLIALGLTNRRWSRILGRESRWIILVPIWTVLLYALFQTLTDFLPTAV